MPRTEFRRLILEEVITVPAATPVLLTTLLAATAINQNTKRLTLHPLDNESNSLEVLHKASGSAPTTGNLDVLGPGSSKTYEYGPAQLARIFVNALVGAVKVCVIQDGV